MIQTLVTHKVASSLVGLAIIGSVASGVGVAAQLGRYSVPQATHPGQVQGASQSATPTATPQPVSSVASPSATPAQLIATKPRTILVVPTTSSAPVAPRSSPVTTIVYITVTPSPTALPRYGGPTPTPVDCSVIHSNSCGNVPYLAGKITSQSISNPKPNYWIVDATAGVGEITTTASKGLIIYGSGGVWATGGITGYGGANDWQERWAVHFEGYRTDGPPKIYGSFIGKSGSTLTLGEAP